jgi:molecular chaperone Hsp33
MKARDYTLYSRSRKDKNMEDIIIRGTAANGQIRAFAASTKDLCEEARRRHDMSPIGAVALGRLLTGGAMMGTMMKNDADIVTIQIKGDGPIGSMTVTADPRGRVKGYVANPQVMLPLKDGKLDIAGALGIGVLSVIKDIGLKEPYVGDTILITSEIGDDLTYYFATSEQVPSSVALGVLMNKDNTVEQAGGFIIQLMPGADEEIVDRLEKSVRKVKSVTELLEEGMTPEDILRKVLGDMDFQLLDTISPQFYCNCSKDRVSKAIMSIGKKDIQDMINDGKPIEVNCHFCNTNYTFSVDELKEMLGVLES